jgi:hypothetical protein
MGSFEVSEGKKIDPTSMLALDSIIEMNLSSSQTELVQSWGLGHSGHYQLLGPLVLNFEKNSKPKLGNNN